MRSSWRPDSGGIGKYGSPLSNLCELVLQALDDGNGAGRYMTPLEIICRITEHFSKGEAFEALEYLHSEGLVDKTWFIHCEACCSSEYTPTSPILVSSEIQYFKKGESSAPCSHCGRIINLDQKSDKPIYCLTDKGLRFKGTLKEKLIKQNAIGRRRRLSSLAR